jgi:hypothetical protein
LRRIAKKNNEGAKENIISKTPILGKLHTLQTAPQKNKIKKQIEEIVLAFPYSFTFMNFLYSILCSFTLSNRLSWRITTCDTPARIIMRWINSFRDGADKRGF